MSDITLHYRLDGSPMCAVCGADIDRPAGRWWLSNTWTRHRSHYQAGETKTPGEYSQPCGSLRRIDTGKTPNDRNNRIAAGNSGYFYRWVMAWCRRARLANNRGN